MQKSIKSWILFLSTVLLSGAFGWANLYEFISVGLLKQTAAYPFGSEGAVPWYYKTAQMYANTCLGFGLLFLGLFIFGVFTFIRNKMQMLEISFVLTILLIFVQILNGQSE